MASRLFKRGRLLHLRNEPVKLWAKVTIGATGAPTLVTANNESKGVASIVRNSTGYYTLTLNDVYSAFLGLVVTPLLAGPADWALRWQLRAVTLASKTVEVEFRDATEAGTNGDVTDPASGAVVYFELTLANTPK